MTDTPNSETKPMAAEMLKFRPETIQRQYAADHGIGDARQRQKAVAQVIEQGCKAAR